MKKSSSTYIHVMPMKIDCSIVNSRLIFVHIPKTAGTTFDYILKQASRFNNKRRLRVSGTVYGQFLGSDKLEAAEKIRQLAQEDINHSSALSGHVPMSVWKDCVDFDDAAFFTLLRDPIDRMVSQYRFGVQRKGWEAGTPISDLIDSGALVDNLQVRMLAGCNDPREECDDTMLETAINMLQQKFAVVGTSEKFNAFIAALIKIYGWPEIIYENYQVGQNKPEQSILRALREEAARFNLYDSSIVSEVRSHGDVWINQVAPWPVPRQEEKILLVSPNISMESEEAPFIEKKDLPNFLDVLRQQGGEFVRFPAL